MHSRLGYTGRDVYWDTQPVGIHGQLAPFSACSTSYMGYLQGLHVVEPLPPNFGGEASKIRGH